MDTLDPGRGPRPRQTIDPRKRIRGALDNLAEVLNDGWKAGIKTEFNFPFGPDGYIVGKVTFYQKLPDEDEVQ